MERLKNWRKKKFGFHFGFENDITCYGVFFKNIVLRNCDGSKNRKNGTIFGTIWNDLERFGTV